ncbi:MAG: PKD repeat protein [Psychroserpens sp.]|jgi:PKD repeat protein
MSFNSILVFIRYLFTLIICLSWAFGCLAKGPGIGNYSYLPSELFTPISLLESPRGHGSVALVDGYLMTIYSSDGGGVSDNGGFDFWDLANPKFPVLFSRIDNEDTHGIREAHGFGLSNSYPLNYAVVQAVEGIQFWDVTDAARIELKYYLDLPGISKGDYVGSWWLFWQAPYVYVAGVDQGLFIVDATDPSSPSIVKNISTNELGGINPGQVFVIGNLMIIAQNGNSGFASFDVSDPETPVLLHTFKGRKGYSHTFAAGTMLTSGGNGDTPKLYVTKVNHDGTFSHIGETGSTTLGNGGYGTYQDGFFHSGFSNGYAKFRIFDQNQNYSLDFINVGSSEVNDADEDFGIVLGNIVFVGNDHGASALIVHQESPDLIGPAVNWVHPAKGAINRARSSRVGISMSDIIDVESLDSSTFSVKPEGGTALEGKYSMQMGIVNFSPNQIFEANTTYIIQVKGIKDVMGNPGPVFNSQFRTGNFLAPTCKIAQLLPVEKATVVNYIPEFISEPQLKMVSWNFGDGSPSLIEPASSSVAHSYQNPGRYTVSLTVKNINGESSCTQTQIVYNRIKVVKPVASKSIIQDLDFVFNVNPDNNTVSATSKVLDEKIWETGVGQVPTSLTIGPDDDIWVINQESATIEVISSTDGKQLHKFYLTEGSAPHSIVYSENYFYVTLSDLGELLKIDHEGNIIARVNVGPTPQSIAIDASEKRILVTRFISATRDLNDLSSLPVGEIIEVNAETMMITKIHPLAYDMGPDTELSGRGVPNYLNAIAISPDGQRAVIASKKDNITRGRFYDGEVLSFESRVRAIISEFDLINNSEVIANRIDLNDRNMPRDVVFSPLGDLFFVALQGNDIVEVRSTAEPSDIITILNVGAAPQGLVIDSINQRLYVHNYLSRSVSIFDISSLLNATGNETQSLIEISTVATEKLSREILNGKRIFYNASDPRLSRDGYNSCAGCHQNGGQDGQIWDLTQAGEGLRNTIALKGKAGATRGNVHWTANFDEIQDFENDIRNKFSGTGLLSDSDFQLTEDPLGLRKAGFSSDLDDLASYVESLNEFSISPYRNSNGSLTLEAFLGKQIFISSRCSKCHSGNLFTDGLRHDVGTIVASSGMGSNQRLDNLGFKTPSLKNLWKTPPYFHNGQAITLKQTLDEVEHAGELTDANKLLLVEYLKQIDAIETAAEITPESTETKPEEKRSTKRKAGGAIGFAEYALYLIFLLFIRTRRKI